MKLTKPLILIGMLFFLCFAESCNEVHTSMPEVIKVDPNAPNAQKKVSIRSIIPLETNTTSVIGEITGVRFYQNRYYVFDNRHSLTLFVFDSNGKYLNKLRRGKGPGEVLEPWDFDIDENGNAILLWDQVSFNLNRYDLDLSFLGALHLPNTAIRSFGDLGNGSFLVFAQYYPTVDGNFTEEVSYDYLLYRNHFRKLAKKILKSNPRTLNFGVDNAISKGKEKYFINPFPRYVYELSGRDSVMPAYEIDMGKYTMTNEDLDKGFKNYRSQIIEGKRIGYVSNLFVSDRYVTFSYMYTNQFPFYIYDRVTHQGFTSYENTSLDQVISKCSIRGMLDDGTFIGVISALDYSEYVNNEPEIQSNHNEISPFSNPLLVLFSVK